MKTEKGKIPHNSLLRSVLRAPFGRKEADQVAADGALVSAPNGPATGASMNTTVYGGADAEKLAFFRAVNSAWAAGIQPSCLFVGLTLPVGTKETEIAAVMQSLQALAVSENIRIAGGHTTCSPQVAAPVFTLTVSGELVAPHPNPQAGTQGGCDSGETVHAVPKEGDSLLLTGFPGDTGAMILCRERGEALRQRFTPEYLSVTEEAADWLSSSRAAGILLEAGGILHDVSEGGILGALWEFAEGNHCGFEVDEKKIPMHQETVEICEWLGGNPYAILSTGCMLAAVPAGKAAETIEKLTLSGIPVAEIGRVLDGRKKQLLRRDEIRCLERPQQDFIMSLENFG